MFTAPPGTRFLRAERNRGNETREAAPSGRPEDEAREAEEKLYCARCGRLVTDGRWRVAVDGEHEHLKFNPAGLAFRIGCFRDAEGAKAAGPPSGEFAWFSGVLWRVALCDACGIHLGWLFTGGEGPSAFFGLILEKLTNRPPG